MPKLVADLESMSEWLQGYAGTGTAINIEQFFKTLSVSRLPCSSHLRDGN